MVGPGDIAPDFTLPDQEGAPITLSALRGKPVVLFFYPKDDSPGCTAEACSFRDHYASFREMGAELIGISGDSSASHARFAGRHRLPYRLLSDADGAVQRAYGVGKLFGLLPDRVTFVIGPDGVIRHRFRSQLLVTRHVREALAALQGAEAQG